MKDLNIPLLRHHQREEMKAEIEQYDAALPFAKPEEKGPILQRRLKTKASLEAQSPEPLTGPEKDKLNVLSKKLKARFLTNMPPDEVMRKNPAGAIDWNKKWLDANKKIVRMWKNIQIQLNPDSSDRDLANIERFRPSGQLDNMRSDAQISGHMSYGNIDESEWPFAAPTNTALEQAKRHTVESVEADVDAAVQEVDEKEAAIVVEGGFGPKGNMSAEAYADMLIRLQKARTVLAKNRSEDKELEATLNELPVGVGVVAA
jgi:hypothetical protein